MVSIVHDHANNVNDTPRTPLDKMRTSFPAAYQKSNGWWAHEDKPDFDFWESPEGNITIHPWTGRSVEEVLSMGQPALKKSDLYTRGGAAWSKQQSRAKLDLLQLAHYMCIPWQFLESLGYQDGYVYENKQGDKTTCVKMGGYCLPDGTPYHKHRVRVSIKPSDKTKFLWSSNTPGYAIACGLHRLQTAVQAGRLFIGEGESDGATFWLHGLPFIGLPGAGTIRSLNVDLIKDIPVIYIIEEPDQAKRNQQSGEGFYADTRGWLRQHGYAGKIYCIRWKQAVGCKDPNELHRAIYMSCHLKEKEVFFADVHEQFMRAIEQACAGAIPEGTGEAEEPEEEESILPIMPTREQAIKWICDLNRVEPAILKPIQKIVLTTIVQHAQWWGGYGDWYEVDGEYLANEAGIYGKEPKEAFLGHLCDLTNQLGLFEKQYENTYYVPKNSSQEKRNQKLFIRPSRDVWFAQPGTWRLLTGVKPRQHGGDHGMGEPKPEVDARPICLSCHSHNVDRYEAYICNECSYTHYEPLETAPNTLESHVVDKKEVDTPKMVVPSYNTIRNPQDGGIRNVLDPELEKIAKETDTHAGPPCDFCSCPLQYDMPGIQVCANCHPRPMWNPGTSKRLKMMYPPSPEQFMRGA